MSNKLVEYKGYNIVPEVNFLPDLKQWDSEFYIEKYSNGKTSERKYAPINLHDSCEKAKEYCIQFGMSVIDNSPPF